MTSFDDFLNGKINKSSMNEEYVDKGLFDSNSHKSVGDDFENDGDSLGTILAKDNATITVLEDSKQDKIVYNYYKNDNRIEVLKLDKHAVEILKNKL